MWQRNGRIAWLPCCLGLLFPFLLEVGLDAFSSRPLPIYSLLQARLWMLVALGAMHFYFHATPATRPGPVLWVSFLSYGCGNAWVAGIVDGTLGGPYYLLALYVLLACTAFLPASAKVALLFPTSLSFLYAGVYLLTLREALGGPGPWLACALMVIAASIFGFFGSTTLDQALGKSFRAQLAVDRAAREANQASRAKSQFLASMSHEIRTPLNGVTGMTELLRDTQLDSEQSDFVETLRASAGSLMSLLNDILDLSKLEAEKLELERISFSLHRVLAEAVDLIAAPAHSRGLQVGAWLDPEVPRDFIGDPNRIRQILANLLSNALKFTHQGHLLVRAERTSATSKGFRIRIRVEDTGIGMTAEQAATIFDPYRQAEAGTSRQYGGTGLGLSICRQLAACMNGTIGVESEPGKGSCFWFEIELETDEQGFRQQEWLRRQRKWCDRRIWMVGCDSLSSQSLESILGALGIRVSEFDSVEALMENASAASAPEFCLVGKKAWSDLAPNSTATSFLTEHSVSTLVLWPLGEDKPEIPDSTAWLVKSMRQPVHEAHLLPLLEELDRPEKTPASGLNQEEISRSAHSKIPVLLAEDNPVNQKVAVRFLRKAGFPQVSIAKNGREAVELSNAEFFPIILMDSQMPEMNGYQAVEAIRKSQAGSKRSTIIALTATAMAGDREKMLTSGMDDYLSKPIDPVTFAETLHHWATQWENMEQA